MRSFSQLKVILKQKQLPDVSLILQDTELWTVVKLYPFCFLSFPRQKQIKEWEKTPKPLLRDNCGKESSGVNVFIGGMGKRKGAKCKGEAGSSITAQEKWINPTSWRCWKSQVLETSLQRGICLTVITSLKLALVETESLRSVRKKGFAVKINLYLLKMSSWLVILPNPA